LNNYQQLTALYLSQQQPQMLERLNFNDGILTPMFSTGVWMYLFFVPFLTMRSFAEEKSQNTFELLMTSPITSWQMVLGKFLGTSTMVVIMSVIPLAFPTILHFYGVSSGAGSAVEWRPVMSAVGFAAIMGISFVGVGMLMSAIAESQIVAALLTFALLLMGYVMPLIANRLEGDWETVMDYVSPITHATRGLQGRVLLEDLVYFISLIIVTLVVTQRVVEAHRWR